METFIAKILTYGPKQNVELAPYTTWKVGGPAEILLKTNSSEELVEILRITNKQGVEYTILGGCSNVLIPDKGLENLVIINHSKNIEILKNLGNSYPIRKIPAQHEEVEEAEFANLDYEDEGEEVLVRFDSGVSLPQAISWCLKNGLTGLQWFAGIPGTVGGALYNNIHSGKKHISDYLHSATIFEKYTPIENGKPRFTEGIIREVNHHFFRFDYDQSILREQKGISVLDVTLRLYKGDVKKAEEIKQKWIKKKADQPKNTAGCVFKNLGSRQQEELELPTNSAGYFIDKVLKLGGKTIGGAKISEKHANFIENTGKATAQDILDLIALIKGEATKKDVFLEEEINILE